MTVTTAVCNAGHRIKIAHRKIEPEGCPVSYVLEFVVEDVDGEDIHTINVFAKKPIEIYRASSERRVEILRSTKVLLEKKGLLVRQIDEDKESNESTDS